MSYSILYRQQWRSYARRELRGGECLFVLNVGGAEGKPLAQLVPKGQLLGGKGNGLDWTNNQTIILPVWYHLRDGYPVGIEDETGWMYRGPVIDLKGGWDIDTHNGHFHFYMPFFEITGNCVPFENVLSIM